MFSFLSQFRSFIVLYLAWVQSLVGFVLSLYFSEVLKYPPCVLCWYQRIALYPLVIIILIGMLLKDRRMPFYALPFSIIGALIALYHNLLYYGVIPESISPCIEGISCTTRYIEWFGFVTIPLLSLIAFIFITVCLLLFLRFEHAKSTDK